jgi:hypothetical protein
LICQGDDAFSEDRIICTESTLGALAKIAYNHLDGKVIGYDDLLAVFSKMPFTSFENESTTSHRLLIEQWNQPMSHVHNGKVEMAAKQALTRIRDYNGEKKILSYVSRQIVNQLKL